MAWTPEDAPPPTDWEPCAPPVGGADPIEREFQADFETAGHVLVGTSTERRPDAVSPDYLLSFTSGPIEVGDTSAGLLARAWKARTDGLNVWIARASEAADTWEAEVLLFSLAGAPIVELDLAFDPNGSTVVCAERATGSDGAAEVWIYFFDPTVTDYAFNNLGPGRTPRVALDDPVDDSGGSDVVLAYLRGASLYTRQSRTRYETEDLVPSAFDFTASFVEEVSPGNNNRLQVWISTRDAGSGRYGLMSVESLLYPVRAGREPFEVPTELFALSIVKVVQSIEGVEVEVVGVAATVADLRVTNPIITWYQPTEPDYAQGSVGIVALELSQPIKQHVQPAEPHYAKPDLTILVFDLAQVILAHTQPTELHYVKPANTIEALEVTTVA